MSVYTLRSGVTNHPESSVLQHLTDQVISGGVLNPGTDMAVGEHGAGGLNVDIAAGRAYLKGTGTNAYPVRNTAAATVEITSNSSGSGRIDTVVLYVDLGATPGSTDAGDDIAVFAVVAGTPAGSPVAPLDADIQTAVGAGNPFERLADITVDSGATGISTEDITQTARTCFMKNRVGIHPITYASTITPDYSLGSIQTCTITGNVTVGTPTNMQIGDFISLELTQDGTGGRTVTWFSNITWLVPDYSINSTASKKSVYVFEKITSTTFNGWLSGKEY